MLTNDFPWRRRINETKTLIWDRWRRGNFKNGGNMKQLEVSEEYFEEIILPKVLANETTCRIYLRELEKRGCVFSKPIDELSHDDCITAGIRIYAHTKREMGGRQ